MNRTSRNIFILSLAMSVWALSPFTRAQTPQLVPNPPRTGTFYSMTFTTNWPPLPCLPFDVPVYLLYTDPICGPVFLYDDTGIDYDALNALTPLSAMTPLDASPDSPGPLYAPGDFYLSILLDTNNPGYVDLVLHNAPSTNFFQLLTNVGISKPLTWYLSQWIPGDPSSNDVWFTAVPYTVPIGAPTNEFFRAVSGVAVASVTTYPYFNPVIEPTSTNQTTQPGWFIISIIPTNATGLNIVYSLTGSAVNGVDYTNIPTTVWLPPGQSFTNIYIQAKYDPKIDFDEQCVLTLVLTNGYLVDPYASAATITISDNLTNLIQVVITNLPVADLDYYSSSNYLIASAYWPYWAETNYFARISLDYITNSGAITTNLVITNWSFAGGSTDEVRITIVKTNGNPSFRPGEMFFTPQATGTVGWVSYDASSWSNRWLTITAESNTFRGDIYVDQTGIWNGDLLVVSGESGPLTGEGMNIWRINTNKVATLVTNIYTSHLEGLVTLPNNPAQYGPWAGKLLTADEGEGLFYAVDTNGVYQSFSLDVHGDPIEPSAMRIIQPNQDLYFSDPRALSGRPPLVLKISRTFFTNSWGDILVTRAGETGHGPALFIVHWDTNITSFISREIDYGRYYAGEFIEHATFAPLDLPPLAQ